MAKQYRNVKTVKKTLRYGYRNGMGPFRYNPPRKEKELSAGTDKKPEGKADGYMTQS